jgi:nitroreductase
MIPTAAGKSARSAAPLHPLLAERWSPRGLDPTHRLTEEQVATLLEAARWAPSAGNSQPWRFAVALRDSPEFSAVLETLAAGNKIWAHAASALLVAVAETADIDGNPRPWAVYDTGQAVAHLSVQAQHEGLVVHQLGGFDRRALAALLRLPAEFVPLVVIAIGIREEAAKLPEPLAGREVAERERLPLVELVLPIASSLPIAA